MMNVLLLLLILGIGSIVVLRLAMTTNTDDPRAKIPPEVQSGPHEVPH